MTRPSDLPVPSNQRLRVLVVDDDRASREPTAQSLQMSRLRPLEMTLAANAGQARGLAEEADVVLVDFAVAQRTCWRSLHANGRDYLVLDIDARAGRVTDPLRIPRAGKVS